MMYAAMEQVCLVLCKKRIPWGRGRWWVIEEVIVDA